MKSKKISAYVLTVSLSSLLLLDDVCAQTSRIHTDVINAPILSVDQRRLEAARCVEDISDRFPGNWVSRYDTTILSIAGEYQLSLDSDGVLTDLQRDQLSKARIGDTLRVSVDYLPANNLVDNPPRKMDYAYVIVPSTFPKPPEGWEDYINTSLRSRLSEDQINLVSFAAYTISLREDGSIDKVKQLEATGDHAVDTVLMAIISEMPSWSPALDIDEIPVPYTVRITLSTMQGSCKINYYRH